MSIDGAVAAVGDRLGVSLAARALHVAAGRARIALCMHRVGPHDTAAGAARLTCPANVLDALLHALTATRPREADPWLTVSFDDGYLDAVEYVRSRAPRFPGVEWLMFICPEKAERGAGFRWDVPGASPDWAKAVMDPATENGAPALLAAGRDPRTCLATVPQLRALVAESGALLGCHTNVHALQTRFTREEAYAEYLKSVADFERLFGPPRHFAFPFGTPVHEVTEEHVRLVWAVGDLHVWTTERRPHTAEEREAGAPLPRFSPNGRWGAGGIALWMAVHAARWRLGLRRSAFSPGLARRHAAGGGPFAGPTTAPARARAPA